MIHLTELIVRQMRIVGVMFCAGVLTESLWLLKTCGVRHLAVHRDGKQPPRPYRRRACRILLELCFWAICGFCLSSFLYYGSFGRLTFYGAGGFLAGLLLWKKLCHHGIMSLR